MLYNYLVKKQGDRNKIKGNLAFLRDINEGSYNSLREIYRRYGDISEIFNIKETNSDYR